MERLADVVGAVDPVTGGAVIVVPGVPVLGEEGLLVSAGGGGGEADDGVIVGGEALSELLDQGGEGGACGGCARGGGGEGALDVAGGLGDHHDDGGSKDALSLVALMGVMEVEEGIAGGGHKVLHQGANDYDEK